MSGAAPRRSDQVEKRVEQLHGCATAEGLSPAQLRLGANEALRQGLPLRDAIVIREAKRFTVPGDALRAWIEVRCHLRRALPTSTYRTWIKPLRPVGAEGKSVLLAAPDGISAWVQRRYAGLISEALQATGSDYTDIEFVSMWEGSTCR